MDAAGRADVDRLGRVLLEVRADVPISRSPVGARHDRRPSEASGMSTLGDLVALRQVGIEVVLAVEERAVGDLAVEARDQA